MYQKTCKYIFFSTKVFFPCKFYGYSGCNMPVDVWIIQTHDAYLTDFHSKSLLFGKTSQGDIGSFSTDL